MVKGGAPSRRPKVANHTRQGEVRLIGYKLVPVPR